VISRNATIDRTQNDSPLRYNLTSLKIPFTLPGKRNRVETNDIFNNSHYALLYWFLHETYNIAMQRLIDLLAIVFAQLSESQ